MPNLDLILDSFAYKRILIVGDISAATGAEFKGSGKEVRPSSAALIALYASNLGAAVSLAGSIGPDSVGNQIINVLRNKNVNLSGITIDPTTATLGWKKCHQGSDKTSLNETTEKQIINTLSKQAINTQAILYVARCPATFSIKIYRELKKVSAGSKIPLAVFSRLPFPGLNGYKIKDDLFLTYKPKEVKLSKELCAEINANECLVFNKKNEFSQINKQKISHCKSGVKSHLYQFEAAISALAVLLLACRQYPNHLPNMAKNMRLNHSHMSISQESGVRSLEI